MDTGVWHLLEALALGSFVLAGWLVIARARSESQRLAHENRQLLAEIERVDDRVWELAASEALHRSLVETLGDLVVRRSGDGRILYANAAFAALLGLTPEEARGSTATPVVVAAAERMVDPDGALIQDELIRLPDGAERWISWIETIVALDGDPTVRQRVGRDVTGRVATERQLEEARARAESASEAKSRFLATVSHEFRTPLNGILGTADLLGDTRLDPEQSAYLRALQISGRALLALVDDILDLTRVEAGKLELGDAPFDPARLVEDVVEFMAPRAQGKGIDIAGFVAPDLPKQLRGDEERIRQILVNLIGNAVKFTARGGVSVRVWREDSGALMLEVADTGPGIAPERHEAVFQEFEQEAAETGRRHGGTGLGLAIVSRLVAAMGGAINLESRVGEGATFTVRLPLAVEEEAAREAPALAGLRLAIVSPSCITREALAGMARAAGASVLVGEGPGLPGDAATTRPDALIIDYALGAEPAEALRAAAADQGVSRILVAISPQERRAMGRPADSGFTGHLVRPVRARSLIDTLTRGRRRSVAAEPAPAPMAAPQPALVSGDAPGLKVLLAEDNDINAMIALRMLERAGAAAIWARDGRAAISEMEEARRQGAPFDLVLMDVRMPELDGLAATRAIRQSEAGMSPPAHTPIIGISANVGEQDLAEARAAGMDDCLPKPTDRLRLIAWLKRAAGRSKPADAAA
jgi:PAS domain S-box-containing protein